MTFPYEVTVPMMRDIAAQAPTAICELDHTMISFNLMVNRDNPPFNDPDLRTAMQLTIDRKAFLDILAEGKGQIGGAMQSPPAGLWGLPPEILRTLPGYGPDVEANRAAARKLMEKHGYGPDKRLAVKVATRNISQYRDPAVIMIDQLSKIYIDGELEVVETANWFPKIARKDYMMAANLTGSGVDDPDAYFYEHYACGSERNYTNYCNPDARENVRAAVDGTRPGQAQEDRLGNRPDADRGRRPADRLSIRSRHLPLPAGPRDHDDGQQHLQRLALR